MMRQVFVDSDVILDVALGRQPFYESSEMVLSLIEAGRAVGVTSSVCISNIYYILRRQGGDTQARAFIELLISYIGVIGVEHADILAALSSDFSDFEDAMQHFAASREQSSAIITRNIQDYQHTQLPIYTPVEFVGMYGAQ